jgi:hypothetical protein
MCKPIFTNGSFIGATLRMTALEELLWRKQLFHFFS